MSEPIKIPPAQIAHTKKTLEMLEKGYTPSGLNLADDQVKQAPRQGGRDRQPMGRRCSQVIAANPKAFQPAAQWLDGLPREFTQTDTKEDCPEGFNDFFQSEADESGIHITHGDPAYIGPVEARRQLGPNCSRLLNAWRDIESRCWENLKRPFQGMTRETARQIILLGALLWDADFTGKEVGLDWEYGAGDGSHGLEGREWVDILLELQDGERIAEAVGVASERLKQFEEPPKVSPEEWNRLRGEWGDNPIIMELLEPCRPAGYILDVDCSDDVTQDWMSAQIRWRRDYEGVTVGPIHYAQDLDANDAGDRKFALRVQGVLHEQDPDATTPGEAVEDG